MGTLGFFFLFHQSSLHLLPLPIITLDITHLTTLGITRPLILIPTAIGPGFRDIGAQGGQGMVGEGSGFLATGGMARNFPTGLPA